MEPLDDDLLGEGESLIKRLGRAGRLINAWDKCVGPPKNIFH